MSQEDESTFFGVNCTSLELSARSTAAKTKTFRLGKRRVFLVFLCFLTISIILYVHKQAVPPKTPKSRKTKRHLKMQPFYQNSQIPMQDVVIVPEKVRPHPKTKPIRQHPNHRYTETGPEASGEDGGFRGVEDRRDWSKRPFEQVSGRVGAEWMGGSNTPSRGLVPSMRIKGIYSQPANNKGNAVDDKLNFSKEINNLLQRGSGAAVKGGERSQREVLKSSGAPFQLPVRQKERRGPKPSAGNPRGRPITIYLDFYPMKEVEGRLKRRRLTQSKGRPPLRVGEGVLLKLNLYPKGGEPESLHGGLLKEHKGAALGYRRKAERKSFGWFSKKKEKKGDEWKECSLMGLNPHGKHITAKWKDENGDWIHAKRVAVKYLAKENDRHGFK